MVNINNQEMKKAFSDSTKTQLSDQPNQVDNSRVLTTIDITPRNHKIANVIKGGTLSNATSFTVYTTPTIGDFYLTGAHLTYIKDATSTATTLSLTVVPKDQNVASPLLRFATFTLTAGNDSESISLNPPILLARNSTILVTSDTAVANIKAQGQIVGYVDESQ